MSILGVTYPLVALLLALSVVGCRHGPSETTQPEPTPEKQPTAETTPSRAGTILVRRDGDLYLLEGQSERKHHTIRRLRHRNADTRRSRSRPPSGGSRVLFARPDRGRREQRLYDRQDPAQPANPRTDEAYQDASVPSPDGEHVLVPGPEGYLLVVARSETEWKEGRCPLAAVVRGHLDGSRVAYMVLADDQQSSRDELSPKNMIYG